MKIVTKPRTSVSSSKIGAILNHNQFRDVKEQWLYDTKQKKPTFTSSSKQKMSMGTRLEPVIKEMVEEFFDISLKVDKNHYMHDDYDFFRVEFDALDYENEIVYEFKNTESDEKHLLENYYPQVQFAMFIVGWSKARICYLRNGWDLGFIEVERDDNFIENMILAGIYYWECIQSVTEPDSDYIDTIANNIEFYKAQEPKKVEVADLTNDDMELLHKWGKLKKEIDLLQIEEARLKGHFADKWGKYKDEYINYSNNEYVRKGALDLVALKKDYPQIDFDSYLKPPKTYQRQVLKYKLPPEEEEVTITPTTDVV